MNQYVFFWGNQDIYSQWYKAGFTIGNVTYNCCEQFMMAEKARLFNDLDTLALIMATNDPKKQKALGRQVKGYDDVKWREHAKMAVYRGNYAKFTQNPLLAAEMLQHRGKTFVEASPYDKVWGIGMTEDDPRAQDPAQWDGTNWLGEIVTLVMEDIITSHTQQAL